MRNKYRNVKLITTDGNFDSKKEYRRYLELKQMVKDRKITNLERQVAYELVPHYIQDGKVIERAVIYKADFTYLQDGETVVEDTKGVKTPEYVIKRKLMLNRYGIRIKEI